VVGPSILKGKLLMFMLEYYSFFDFFLTSRYKDPERFHGFKYKQSAWGNKFDLHTGVFAEIWNNKLKEYGESKLRGGRYKFEAEALLLEKLDLLDKVDHSLHTTVRFSIVLREYSVELSQSQNIEDVAAGSIYRDLIEKYSDDLRKSVKCSLAKYHRINRQSFAIKRTTKKRKRIFWAKAEDERLRAAYEEAKKVQKDAQAKRMNWTSVALAVGNDRTNTDCSNRIRNLNKSLSK